jgi:uncharacterized protein YndB with AHSA1/START domain
MSTPEFTYVIHVATTPGKLWQALTGAIALKENWGNIQSQWTKGSRVTEVDESGKVLWKGEVLRSEPGRLLSYTMDGDEATQVTVEFGPPLSEVAPRAAVVAWNLPKLDSRTKARCSPAAPGHGPRS